MEAWDTRCGRSLEVEEFKEDVDMPIEGFGDALVRRIREEEHEKMIVKFIWNLHELDFTDEKISKAVDQPIEYVQEVLKKERPSQEVE